jgi:hypothetical protein
LDLVKIGRVKKPIHDGLLGSLFISFMDTSGRPSRELIAVTVYNNWRVRRRTATIEWQVRVYAKDTNRWQKGSKKGWAACREQEITKIQLKASTVSLESVMVEVVKFLGPDVKLLAGQLDLDGKRSYWINPNLVNSDNFKTMVDARAQVNNGCSEKQKRFFMKLEKMCSWDLGWQEPDALFAEIEHFRRGFEVWL